jgi:hypothetical protein
MRKDLAKLEKRSPQARIPSVENQDGIGCKEDQMHSACEHVRAIAGED